VAGNGNVHDQRLILDGAATAASFALSPESSCSETVLYRLWEHASARAAWKIGALHVISDPTHHAGRLLLLESRIT
jgi:hypothetical protein